MAEPEVIWLRKADADLQTLYDRFEENVGVITVALGVGSHILTRHRRVRPRMESR